MIPAHIASWALTNDKKRNNSNEGVAAVVATRVHNINDRKKKPVVDDTETVLETKGGGGYQPPPQPSPQEQAEARNWEAQQDFDREQKRQDAIDAQNKIDKDAKDAAWLSSKNAAYEGAKTGARSRLNSLGLASGDQYGVYDQILGRYDTANAGLQAGADYSGAFSNSIVDELLGSARTGQRNKYNTQFSTAVSPYYAEDEFGDTSDDAILSSILDQQYGDALADLTASRDRGATNQATYNRALRDLDNAKFTANTDLQGIGRGIREDIIGDVGNRRQTALDAAANWDFGSVYDPTQEAERVRNYASGRKSTLEGDIRGAVGGREFFDINSLLGKASAKVGNQSTGTTGTSALYDTFENEAERDTENTRRQEGTF